MTWSSPTTWDEVCRRATGRRAHNQRRQDEALIRRTAIAEYMVNSGLTIYDRGVQKHLATTFGVSKSTISRDVQHLLSLVRPCPTCGQFPVPRIWDLLGKPIDD